MKTKRHAKRKSAFLPPAKHDGQLLTPVFAALANRATQWIRQDANTGAPATVLKHSVREKRQQNTHTHQPRTAMSSNVNNAHNSTYSLRPRHTARFLENSSRRTDALVLYFPRKSKKQHKRRTWSQPGTRCTTRIPSQMHNDLKQQICG